MRLELNENKEVVSADIAGAAAETATTPRKEYDSVSQEIKEQRAKFSELDFKHKIGYIYDYYKWHIVISIVVIFAAVIFIRDFRDNLRPTYLSCEFINSYFASDNSNTVMDDYVSQYDIDLETYHVYINSDIVLSNEAFDTMMIASQQKLVSMYSAQDIDVVIGPVGIMEGAANCDCYARFDDIIPADLIEELKDRDYEFYYFDPSKDEIEDYDEDVTPYFAGVYLDNCSYLNNNGEYGAYGVATTPEDRPIFTIAANTKNVEHAIEFLRFLIQNR